MPKPTKGTVVPNPFQPVMIDTVDREALFGGLISAGHTVEYARVQADTLPSTDGALQMLARHRLQAGAAMVEPWKNFDGPLPDYDHVLRPVYESGIQYAVELLAKDLEVEAYNVCDGTEEFDGDLGGTMCNIIREVMPIDADGDKMYPGDVRAAFDALTAELKALADAVLAVIPSGIKDDRIAGDKVFPLYLRMDEIRSLASLATLAKCGGGQ